MFSKGAKLLATSCARIAFFPPLVYGLLLASGLTPTWIHCIGGFFLAALLESVILGLVRRRGRHAQMQQLGAQEIPKASSKLPGGLNFLYELLMEVRQGYVGSTFRKWHDETNSDVVDMTLLGYVQIFTYNPEHIKRILATEFDKFEKGTFFKESAESVLGTGIFNVDDELWKFHRGITRPFFRRERISDFNLFHIHADDAIAKLKRRLSEGEAVDFQDLASRFTMDTATEFLLGSCVHSLDADLPYAYNSSRHPSNHTEHPSDKFARSFANAQTQVSLRNMIGDTWPLWEIFGDKSKRDVKNIMSFIDPVIQKALRAKEADLESRIGPDFSKEALDDETLLSHMIKMTDSQSIIRDEVINIMVAGRDTTAATLTFAVYMMTQHPDVVMKLRDEVLRTVGANRPPTLEDIRNMKYLRAFINETLRLFPPVPHNVRRTKQATTFPSTKVRAKPWFIPEKTDVIYSVFLMHRAEEFWGPTAQNFDPNRFIDERVARYLVANPFVFLPFNAGPRICLGQQFAYHEVSFFIIRLLQSFDTLSLDSNAQPPNSLPRKEWMHLGGRAAVEKVFMKANLTLSVKGGLWIRMTECEDS